MFIHISVKPHATQVVMSMKKLKLYPLEPPFLHVAHPLSSIGNDKHSFMLLLLKKRHLMKKLRLDEGYAVQADNSIRK